MSELKDKGKHIIETINERREDILTKWEDRSRELVDNFVSFFFKTPFKLWNNSKDKIVNAINYDTTSSEDEEVEGLEQNSRIPTVFQAAACRYPVFQVATARPAGRGPGRLRRETGSVFI
ncbi:hypothetical protein NQ318_014340 [Aromia moschata]|uniref:Uncharacterized protein n=1 Tax=Aromia moschata TaxID=1265417 RepID=A0AAV8Z1N0_9CUCU|nr:hypothetical protein NQ318_014340 [Aromia moschata]